MRPCLRLAVLLVALALPGCAGRGNHARSPHVAKTQAEDIQAVRQLAETWRAAWLTGDVELILSLYADDPVLMPQDHPAVGGQEAIRALLESAFADYSITSDSTLHEIVVSGDWAYFFSTYNLTATPKDGGEPIHSVGKSVFILRREAGNVWKITRLIDNSDGPAEQDNHAP